MNKFLIVAAVLAGGVAAIALARRALKNRAAKREERHLELLRGTLGIKTGVKDKAAGKGSDGKGKSVLAEPTDPKAGDKGGQKPPSTALMLHPDSQGLRVNGAWLHTINMTIEPDPIHGTRASIRASLERARRFNNDCNTARKQHKWDVAEEHAQKALAEVNSGLRRDHWFTAEVLNQYGCLRYEQGFYTEAREIWDQAEQVCQEWPTSCKHILPTIQSNLKLVKNMLGY